MKIKTFVLTLSLLVFALPCFGLSGNVGESLQKIVLDYPDGKKFDSTAFSGKHPLMMVFWATWCIKCVEEIPHVKKIFRKFEPKGLKVIGVNVGVRDTTKQMKDFVNENTIPYPVAFDRDSRVTKYFGIKYIPLIIITDKNGIIKYRAHKLPEDFNRFFDQLIK